VAADSPLHNLDDVRRHAELDSIDFIFVHPLSMSGRVLPENMLRDIGTRLAQDQMSYSYSHSRSMELLTRPNVGRLQVALVWDDALFAATTLSDSVRHIEFPELDRMPILNDLILVRSDFEFAPELSRLLIAYKNKDIGFEPIDQAEYDKLVLWNRHVRIPHGANDELRLVSVKKIGQILLHSSRSLNIPPRVALVLSGGGVLVSSGCRDRVGGAPCRTAQGGPASGH